MSTNREHWLHGLLAVTRGPGGAGPAVRRAAAEAVAGLARASPAARLRCREQVSIMIGMYAIVAFALVAGGAAAGIVVVVSLGIHRERKGHPGWAAAGARAASGLYVRRPRAPHRTRARQQDLLARR